MTISQVLEVEDLHAINLAGVSLTCGAGERVAIIGESGCGKSVLLRCVLGLMKAERGRISILGEPNSGGVLHMEGVGTALQNPGLLDGWSVADNLRLAASRELDDDEIRELLHSVALQRVSAAAKPSLLSGGQQKRVSLLRALLRATRLLILDEPTSGLDPHGAELMSSLLQQQCEDRGLALLLVTHNYNLAASLCHRVLVLTGQGLRDVTPRSTRADDRVTELRQELEAAKAAAIPELPPSVAGVHWGVIGNLWHFARRGIPLPCLAMALLGAGLVVQSASAGFLDLSRWVPELTVVSVMRELAPLVVGLLLASSIGARISSEVSAMSYTGQLDSMRLLGISSGRKLLLPYLVASLVVFPCAVMAGAVAAVGAGGVVAGMSWSGLTITTTRFFVLALDSLTPVLVISCVVKGVVMGFAVASTAYYVSNRAIRSAVELGSRVTAGAVLSSIVVVLVDVLITWIAFS